MPVGDRGTRRLPKRSSYSTHKFRYQRWLVQTGSFAPSEPHVAENLWVLPVWGRLVLQHHDPAVVASPAPEMSGAPEEVGEAGDGFTLEYGGIERALPLDSIGPPA